MHFFRLCRSDIQSGDFGEIHVVIGDDWMRRNDTSLMTTACHKKAAEGNKRKISDKLSWKDAFYDTEVEHILGIFV